MTNAKVEATFHGVAPEMGKTPGVATVLIACDIFCDDDCEAACHSVHHPTAKKEHTPGNCPAGNQ